MNDITNQEIEAALKCMREIATNPQKRAEMETAWGKVLDVLEPHYLAIRPRMKGFEVHHANEAARARFAHALAAGRPMEECTRLAIEQVTGEMKL